MPVGGLAIFIAVTVVGIVPPTLSAADGRPSLSLASKGGPQPYTVVLNWQAGLKK